MRTLFLLTMVVVLYSGCSKPSPRLGDVYEYLPTKERFEITAMMYGRDLTSALDTATAIPPWREGKVVLIRYFRDALKELDSSEAIRVTALMKVSPDSALLLSQFFLGEKSKAKTRAEDKRKIDSLKRLISPSEYFYSFTRQPSVFDLRPFSELAADRRYKKLN